MGGQYYLQTRMLSNVDNAEKTISGKTHTRMFVYF
ncbi:hypothetical protein ACVQ92_12265 [Staphylococcus aureus]